MNFCFLEVDGIVELNRAFYLEIILPINNFFKHCFVGFLLQFGSSIATKVESFPMEA